MSYTTAIRQGQLYAMSQLQLNYANHAQLRLNKGNPMQCRNCNWIMQSRATAIEQWQPNAMSQLQLNNANHVQLRLNNGNPMQCCNCNQTKATACNVAQCSCNRDWITSDNSVAAAITQENHNPAESRIAISKNFSSRRISIAISHDRRTNKTRPNSG